MKFQREKYETPATHWESIVWLVLVLAMMIFLTLPVIVHWWKVVWEFWF